MAAPAQLPTDIPAPMTLADLPEKFILDKSSSQVIKDISDGKVLLLIVLYYDNRKENTLYYHHRCINTHYGGNPISTRWFNHIKDMLSAISSTARVANKDRVYAIHYRNDGEFKTPRLDAALATLLNPDNWNENNVVNTNSNVSLREYSLECEKDKLIADLKESEKKVQLLQSKITELQEAETAAKVMNHTVLETIDKKASLIQASVEKLIEEKERLAEENEKLLEANEALKIKLMDAESGLLRSNIADSTNTADSTNVDSDFDDKQAILESLLGAVEQERNELTKQSAELNKRIEELTVREKTVNTFEIQLNERKNALDARKAELDILMSTLGEFQDTLDKRECLLKPTEDGLDRLTAVLNKRQRDVEERETTLEFREKTFDEMKKKVAILIK